MIKKIIINVFVALQVNQIVTVPHDEPHADQAHLIDQNQVKELLVSHYHCRERLNVRLFSYEKVDDCTTKPHDVAEKKQLLICLKKRKELLSELTNVPSHL